VVNTQRYVAVLAWKRWGVIMISTYHKDETHVAISKANQEETTAITM
jgi:hypothetical protein